MPDVQQAASGGKGGGLPSPRAALARFLLAAIALRDAWQPSLEGPAYPRSLPSFRGLVREIEAWLADVEARPALTADEIPALDLDDRQAVRDWLTAMRTKIDDAIAAGEDATRAPAERALGRKTAHREILDARDALDNMLRAAERGAAARP